MIDDMAVAAEALRRALDAQDVAAIESAAIRLDHATRTARAQGAWRADPALRESLRSLSAALDSTRVRTRILSDQAAQRLSLLAAHGAATAPLTYGR